MFVASLPSNAQQTDTVGVDLDFMNKEEKKLFRMNNYYSRKTQRNGQVKQRKHRIICLDPVTNQYQEINVKGIYLDKTYKMQDAITVVDENGGEHHLTPDSIEGFVTKGEYYLRRTITFQGKRMTKFLLREDVFKDENIRVYSYEDEKSLRDYYYVQFADDEDPQLMQDGGLEHLKEILLKDQNAKDGMTQRMIADMQPNVSGVRKVYQALKAGGYSHLQRFRWGIAVAGGISKVNASRYSLDSKMVVAPGIFVEIPIASKVSFVPELYFSKMSVKGKMGINGTLPNSAVYNRTEISIPLMVRYTLFNVHGNFIPYAQAGVAPNFGLKQNFDYRQVVEENKGSFEVNSYVVEGSEDVSALQASAVAGIGTEWIIGSKHSLFFELRGAIGLSHYGRNDIMFVVGLKL